MKILASILVLIFSLILVSCPTSEVALELSKPKSEIVLEFSNKYEGSWGMTGEVLGFRLYSDKMAEFDDYPQQKPGDKTLKAEEVKIKKQIQISEEDFKEILEIVNSEDFLKAKDIYKQKPPGCLDAFEYLTIHFRQENKEKTIKIDSFCVDLTNPYPRDFQTFPQSLSKLIIKIREIKSKELGKQVFTP